MSTSTLPRRRTLPPSPNRHPFRPAPWPRPRHRLERAADAVVLWAGWAAGVAGTIWMLAETADASATKQLAVIVYAAGLLGMLSASLAYNTARRHYPRLQRLDHAMIFVMIAGTYTPVTVIVLDPDLGMTLAAIVWTGAGIGIALTLVGGRRLERLKLALYLGLGWTAVIAAEPLARKLPPESFTLLVIGGLLYTGGTALHVAERLPFARAGWHTAVALAALCHFFAIREFCVA